MQQLTVTDKTDDYARATMSLDRSTTDIRDARMSRFMTLLSAAAAGPPPQMLWDIQIAQDRF